MKKWIILSLLLSTLPLAAQSTVATGTVSDSTGATYPSAVVSCSIQSSTGETPTINGSPVPSPVTATSDGSGVVSMTLTDNQQIKPTNTKWRCNVIAAAGAPQFTTTSTVSGGSATLPFAGAMPPLSSLASVPFTGAPTGSCYFLQTAVDTSNGALYGCTSTFPGTTGSWVQAGGGGASISGTLTPGDVPVATGAHTLGDSHIQDNGSVVYFSEPASYELGTAGAGGVTQNLLAAADTSDPARYVLPVSGNCGVGFALSTATVGNTFFLGNVVQDVYTGVADNTITSGHILVGGTSTPGRVKDSGGTQITGVSVGTCVVGKALASASTGATVPVMYMGLGTFGTSGTATYTGTPTANILAKFTGSAGQVGNSSVLDDGTAPTRTPNGVNTATGSVSNEYPNANPGTVTSNTVCVNSSHQAYTCGTGDVSGLLQGCAISGAGNSGTVVVGFTSPSCQYDGPTTINHVSIVSTTLVGALHDTGGTVGIPGVDNFLVDATNAGGTPIVQTDILTPRNFNQQGGGGKGTLVLFSGNKAQPNADFTNTTPAAETGYILAKEQHSNSGNTTSASFEVPYASSSTKGVVQPDNSTITISNGVISSAGGGITFTAPLNVFSVSGSPGSTIGLGFQQQNSSYFLAGPNTGSAQVPFLVQTKLCQSPIPASPPEVHTCTFDHPVQAGDTLIFSGTYQNSTVVDSLGQTFLQASNNSVTWYYPNTIAGSDTVSVTFTGGHPGVLVMSEWSGLTTSPLDASAGSGGFVNPPSWNSITTSNAHDLIYSYQYCYNMNAQATAFTPGVPFVFGALGNSVSQGGSYFGGMFMYDITTSTGTYSPTATMAPANCAGSAAFTDSLALKAGTATSVATPIFRPLAWTDLNTFVFPGAQFIPLSTSPSDTQLDIHVGNSINSEDVTTAFAGNDTASTLFAVPAGANLALHCSVYVDCFSAVATATSIPALLYTDASSTAETLTGTTATCTTLGTNSTSSQVWPIRAKASTTVYLKTTIANSPHYDVHAQCSQASNQ